MIPKIDYQIHEVLTNVFLPPSKKRSEFKRDARKFERYFKKYEKDVLRLIEKFSGFKWSKKRIPLYLVPEGRFFSITKGDLENGLPGVVQKVHAKPERTIHILIHELVHANQFPSDFYSKNNSFIKNKSGSINHVKFEVCTDIVCIHVIRKLFGKNSKIEKDYWHFMNNLMNSAPKKKKEIPKYLKRLDLNKKTLREYIINK